MASKKVLGIAVAVVVIAIAVGAVIMMMAGSRPPSIQVSDQVISADTVTIDTLFLDKAGYVVIHKVTEEGKPGPVIGYSALLNGSNENVAVKISDHDGLQALFAMLHYDDGDGSYQFPGPDKPTFLEEKIVLTKFKLS